MIHLSPNGSPFPRFHSNHIFAEPIQTFDDSQLTLPTLTLPSTSVRLFSAMQRRLFHCTRCLRTNAIKDINLPSPSVPEPLNPPNPSVKETPRVSLSIDSMRKVPSRSWDRTEDQTRGLLGAKSKNPLAKEQLQREGKEPKLFKDGAREKLQAQLRAGRYVLPPIPAPRSATFDGTNSRCGALSD
jgi:hypothetical protein